MFFLDIIQFKDLVYSAYGSKQVNRLPNTLGKIFK